MTKEGFDRYLHNHFSNTSGAASSYLMAITILDNIFRINDVFNLNGKSLCCIDDIEKLIDITDFVKSEEAKFRNNEEGFFRLGNSKQKSYPKGGFCSAAMKSLINYYEYCMNESADEIAQSSMSGKSLSKKLLKLYDIPNDAGEETIRETKTRIGQDYFRKMLLENYNGKCSITGIDVPQVLRASHIVAWSEDKENRMNPENGILLSATYDAAFDRHLISFDDQYRMIVSKEIKDHYSSAAAKEYFLKKEGTKLALPTKFEPSQIFLQKHRDIFSKQH